MISLPFAVNIFTILLVLIALALLMWSVQAYRESESPAEAGQMLGNKAARTTGGIVGFISALTVGLLVGIQDAGMELSQVGTMLGDLVANSPELVMGIVTAVLGALGISGQINIGLHTYVGLAFILLGAGAVIKSRQSGASR
ncbi:MAG: hypothetical protein ACOCUO_00485 [archaeon]